jgi:hypothetical protein
MNALLSEALDRTMRLMRDDLVDTVDESTLMSALISTEIVLVGDSSNLCSHGAQCAYITAALLMARSGHRVYLAAPNVPLVSAQPPLKGGHLLSALLEIGNDLLPGIGFSVYPPRRKVALCVCFGNSPPRFAACRTISVNATAWSSQLGPPLAAQRWIEEDWPYGAIGAGALASTEAFKAAMRTLRPFAKDAALFESLFAFTEQVRIDLAPSDTAKTANLDDFDFVSGGAITNAALYVLARLPNVEGFCRILEPEVGDFSNLNRYAMLRQSAVGKLKADVLEALMPPRLKLRPFPIRYEGGRVPQLGEFALNVLVGVDDIPTRWKVQNQNPRWLGIGATTHWAAMASYHRDGLPCARCLHPRDEAGTGPIPTVAFVSLFAGLALAAYFVRMRAGGQISVSDQYVYFSPLRPQHIWRSPVGTRGDCPNCATSMPVRAA